MLILSLPHNPKSEVFYVQASANAQLIQTQTVPISGLPLVKDEVVGVLPWQQVSWHLIQVPKEAQKMLMAQAPKLTGESALASKAQQLLAGLLEEHLLDELDQLHWIAGHVQSFGEDTNPASPVSTSGPSQDNPLATLLWVACCKKEWLKSTLDALEEHQLHIDRLVPEFEPSLQERHLFACDGPLGLEFILTDSQGVLGFPREALNAFHQALSGSLKVHVEPSVSAEVATVFQGDLQVQTRAQRLLMASQSPWNFARGQWAQGAARRILKTTQRVATQVLYHPHWKMARLGLLLMLVLNVLMLNAWAWHERQVLQNQQEALSRILKDTFPEVQVVIDPSTQMRRSLQALKEKTASPGLGDFEHLLSALTQLSVANASLDLGQIQSLRFASNELTLVWKTPQDAAHQSAIQMPADLKSLGYLYQNQGQESHLRWSFKP